MMCKIVTAVPIIKYDTIAQWTSFVSHRVNSLFTPPRQPRAENCLLALSSFPLQKNRFTAKWIAAEKAKGGLWRAVVCPNATGRTKKRIA